MYIVGLISISLKCAIVNFELWGWKNEELEVDFVSYEEDKLIVVFFYVLCRTSYATRQKLEEKVKNGDEKTASNLTE